VLLQVCVIRRPAAHQPNLYNRVTQVQAHVQGAAAQTAPGL
jgi:hypothetical protein